MATIQRPLKTYGNRTYVAEVAAAPSNQDPILANEVDGDIDTMYSAWNGGADTVNIKDGAVTYAKLAPDAQLWKRIGTVLSPTTTGDTVSITGTNMSVSGGQTVKMRLVSYGASWANVGGIGVNQPIGGGAGAYDDPTLSKWELDIDPQVTSPLVAFWITTPSSPGPAVQTAPLQLGRNQCEWDAPDSTASFSEFVHWIRHHGSGTGATI